MSQTCGEGSDFRDRCCIVMAELTPYAQQVNNYVAHTCRNSETEPTVRVGSAGVRKGSRAGFFFGRGLQPFKDSRAEYGLTDCREFLLIDIDGWEEAGTANGVSRDRGS